MALLLVNLSSNYRRGEDISMAESLLINRRDKKKHYVQINGILSGVETSAGSRIAEWNDLEEGSYDLITKLLDSRGRSVDVGVMNLVLDADSLVTLVVPRRTS